MNIFDELRERIIHALLIGPMDHFEQRLRLILFLYEKRLEEHFKAQYEPKETSTKE